MTDKSAVLQIIGSLMRRPQYLSETDKYKITPDDFSSRLEKIIFIAIDSLYRQGAQKISPIDIENYLETNATAKKSFVDSNGIGYLQDAEALSDELTFDYYYNRLKKVNLINTLNKKNIGTKEFFNDDIMDPKALETNENFENLSVSDILNTVKAKILNIERDFLETEEVKTWNVYEEIGALVESFGKEEDVGLSINGEICSQIINGAELGALTIRSGGSGIAKTRLSVSDACKLAYPIYYDLDKDDWVISGYNEKVLFIMTEQKPEQIMKMIIAYLTGINESKFKFAAFTKEEQKRIDIALKIIEFYQDNLVMMRIPNPNIQMVKHAIREKVITHQIKYCFYDYIFISPSLLSEFRGHNIRNDEALLMFATALKDIAIEQNIAVITSTQVNANADNNNTIRNEASLAGGRSTIKKEVNG